MAVSEISLADAVDCPGKCGRLNCCQLAALGTDDISGDHTAADGEIRVLGNIQLSINHTIRGVQCECAGFYGNRSADIGKQFKRAALVFLCLRRSQCLCKGRISRRLAVLGNHCRKVASALRTLMRVFIVSRVFALRNGDGKDVRIKHIAI